MSGLLNILKEPVPYRCVDGFMGEEMVARLLALALEREADFTPTRVGRKHEGRLDPKIRISRRLRDPGDLKAELESRFSPVIGWALRELRMPPIDLADLEVEFAAHGDGAFYAEHVDTMTGPFDATSDRALTGVYYFHRQPKRFGGGELRLYAIGGDRAGRRHVDITPGCDTLLLFPSWAPHEVRPVSCPSGEFADSRFAINFWCHRRRSAGPSPRSEPSPPSP